MNIYGSMCAKVCYLRQTYIEHLQKVHEILDADVVEKKVESTCISRGLRFWCGFCVKLIDVKNKGNDVWAERFDHIDDHFMGRHGLVNQSIEEWIPIDGNMPKGDEGYFTDIRMVDEWSADLDDHTGNDGPQHMASTQSAPRQRIKIACRYCRRCKVSLLL
jgi:hypothetical protein